MLWLFLNNRNALWHEAKVVSWLIKEMTTTSSESSGAYKCSVCDQFLMLFVEVTLKTLGVSD